MRVSQPPPYKTLYAMWYGQPHLRFGQWFVNNYMPSYHGHDIDILYNTCNTDTALNLIRKFYIQYQWEL